MISMVTIVQLLVLEHYESQPASKKKAKENQKRQRKKEERKKQLELSVFSHEEEVQQQCLTLDSGLHVHASLATPSTTDVAVSTENLNAGSSDYAASPELQQCLHSAREQTRYYRNKLKEQEKKEKLLTKQYRLSILSIRHFWKDMIYKECSRGGQILKHSLKNSYNIQNHE